MIEKRSNHRVIHVLLVMVLVGVFEATGTLIGVSKWAGLLEAGPAHTSKGLGHAFMVGSTAILAGSMLGTSSTTAYVESASSVQGGGHRGLTALVIAVLFLLATFFLPLAGAVPAYAIAPAFLCIAALMMRELTEVECFDATDAAPAMPFTYSIANGLAFGFTSCPALKAFTRRSGRCALWPRCLSPDSHSSTNRRRCGNDSREIWR